MLKLLILNKKYVLTFFFFSFLLFKTGIHGDELFEILKTSRINNLYDFILYTDELITSPFAHLFFWWAYPLIGNENLYLYDILKIILHGLSVYFLYKFFSQYLDSERAFLSSLIFIVYPTHDSSVFVYMFSIYTFVPCLIMYCHYKINKGNYLISYPILVFASFTHYLTPPYIIGLSFIFLIGKEYKKFFIFISSFFLYFLYYISVGFLSPEKEKRVEDSINLISFIKNILLQFITSIDSFFGPSFFIKIFFSLASLNFYSLFVGFVIIFFLLNTRIQKRQVIPWRLLISLLSVFIISLLMFALTNMYSQITFGLGNRVTIYGSLLFSVIILLIPLTKARLLIILIIFILPSFGLAEHWKDWNFTQLQISSNINENNEIESIKQNDLLLVVGNNYSQLGPFSHIEFFSMDWHTNAIFMNKLKTKKVLSLSENIKFIDNHFINKKNGKKTEVTGYIFVYDSDKNTLRTIKEDQIYELLKKLPRINRHWIQLIDNTKLKEFILTLSPRLDYLF